MSTRSEGWPPLTITPQLKATMLKQLVAGHDLDFVAQTARIPRDRVLDIVSNHGYPDKDKMAWAIDVLLDTANKIPDRPAANGHSGYLLQDAPASSTNAQPTVHKSARPAGFALVPPATLRPAHTSAAELLHQAGESPHARTRGLGAKISALLADLTKRLADEQEAREAAAKDERENAKVAERIAALEAELAKLKGKRAKKNTGKIPHSPRSTTGKIPSESAVIRQWARANNISCPTRGAIAKDVREAYQAASAGGAA